MVNDRFVPQGSFGNDHKGNRGVGIKISGRLQQPAGDLFGTDQSACMLVENDPDKPLFTDGKRTFLKRSGNKQVLGQSPVDKGSDGRRIDHFDKSDFTEFGFGCQGCRYGAVFAVGVHEDVDRIAHVHRLGDILIRQQNVAAVQCAQK